MLVPHLFFLPSVSGLGTVVELDHFVLDLMFRGHNEKKKVYIKSNYNVKVGQHLLRLFEITLYTVAVWAWTRHCSRHLPLGGARTQGFDYFCANLHTDSRQTVTVSY